MKTSIMIVDDEVSMDKLIRRIFRREQHEEKYDFFYFGTAEEAYQFIGISRNVDIVLLDIKMPGKMDGLTLLEKIHKMNPLIKVIMISAYGDMKRSRLAMQHGAFDFLEKPIDPEDLKFVIGRAVEHALESKKVSSLISQLDTIGYFVKNEIIEFVKNKSISHVLEDCKKEIVTILVAQIRDYLKQSAKLQPVNLVKQLNEYHTEITKAVDMYSGHIDKYLGDSVLAVFSGKNHLENAVKAGIKIRSLIHKLNQTRVINQEQTYIVSIVINSGEAITGNIGSTDPLRFDHTVIGYPVNVCFLLQKIAAEGEILFPRNKYTEILLESFACRQKVNKTLRMVEKEFDVFNIEAGLGD